MNIGSWSRTWQNRLGAGRQYGRRAAVVALSAAAALGACAGVKVFMLAPHPNDGDITAITHQVDNQRDAAGQYGADCVAMMLTTPIDKIATLQPCLTLPKAQTVPQPNRGATPAPWVIDTPKVWSVAPKGSAGEANLYAVTVMVQQRPYPAAPAARAFYLLKVSMWHYQPRALDWPVPTSDPGPGADIKLGYDHPLPPSGQGLYPVVSGFITAYLTGTGGLDRYVVADSWIKPIGGYHNPVVLDSVDTVGEVPDNPATGTVVHVRAVATAQTSQFATINYSFPLTAENNGGTWMISDIDFDIQTASDSDAIQVGTQN